MPTVKVFTLFKCSICGLIFDNEQGALECEEQGEYRPEFSVGDFVTTDTDDYGRFGWFDGDADWVMKKPRGLHSDKQSFSLIYVVTAVEPRNHMAIYHLGTKAMTRKSGYRFGWTIFNSHYHLYAVDLPIALDQDGLLGVK